MAFKIGVGLFTGQIPPGSSRTFHQEYREVIELVKLVEDEGLDAAWVSEHHFAEDGYLPLQFKGPAVAHTVRAQADAAAHPPDGDFDWRYSNTPSELKKQWKPETGNVIVRGAIMMFQDERHLTVDGLPCPDLWKALLKDAADDNVAHHGYSYVYVHRDQRPQQLTLWHNGKSIFTSPCNTGVPAAPTALGTFPVFEHLAVTTMTGTNPGGGHYSDKGIKWVSYFNGGDAVHAFDRASFGTPQSVGCV